jgi:hypothetical protein
MFVTTGSAATVLLWTLNDSAGYGGLWGSIQSPTARSFTRAIRIQRGTEKYDVETPHAVVDDSGQLDVVWYSDDPDDSEPYIQIRNRGSLTWAPPRAFGGGSNDLVSTSTGGTFDITGSGGDYFAIPHPRGGTWGKPETIWEYEPTSSTDAGFGPGLPVGAANLEGALAAVWGFATGESKLMVSVRSTDAFGARRRF